MYLPPLGKLFVREVISGINTYVKVFLLPHYPFSCTSMTACATMLQNGSDSRLVKSVSFICEACLTLKSSLMCTAVRVAPRTGRNPERLHHCWGFHFMSSQLQVVCTTSSWVCTQSLPWHTLTIPRYHDYPMIILVICKLQSLRERLSKAWRPYGALFSSDLRKWRPLYLSKAAFVTCNTTLRDRREMVS